MPAVSDRLGWTQGGVLRLPGAPLPYYGRAEQTMHMPATQDRWTAAAVRALPDDGNRYELIGPELLVTPAPRTSHQRAVFELAVRLRGYLDVQQVGEVLVSPADIELEPDTIVQPDVFVLAASAGEPIREWPDVKRLLLACEVLSPNTARYDRVVKRRFFARTNVDEYWVLDPEAELVERTRRGDERVEVITDDLTWHPHGEADPLIIALPEFFRGTKRDR